MLLDLYGLRMSLLTNPHSTHRTHHEVGSIVQPLECEHFLPHQFTFLRSYCALGSALLRYKNDYKSLQSTQKPEAAISETSVDLFN